MTSPDRPAIVLVGPMGAGKSTVGRQLAAMLRWNFLDTDRELEERLARRLRTLLELC